MWRNFAGVVFCSALLALGGCGKEGIKPTVVDAVIQAAETLNPDASGRPSPVVVRVYELRSSSIFENADFFSLYEEEAATLGPDLIAHDEMEIQPGQGLKYDKALDPATRYVGVIAAFRDLENARWRDFVKVGDNKRMSLQIGLESTVVTVVAAQEPAQEP